MLDEVVRLGQRMAFEGRLGQVVQAFEAAPLEQFGQAAPRATSKLGWAPKEANTPPVRGFIRVTHITGNSPPSEAS